MSEQGGGDLSTQDLARAGQGGQGSGAAQEQPAGGQPQQAQPGGYDTRQPQHAAGGDRMGADVGQGAAGGEQTPAAGERQQFAQDSTQQSGREAQAGDSGGFQQGQAMGSGGSGGLVQDGQGFRQRWTEIQAAFVDEPRRAVEQADGLVAEVIQHLARTFAEERSSLERQWAGGNSVSTEDLRVSLQRYRQFFQTLLRD